MCWQLLHIRLKATKVHDHHFFFLLTCKSLGSLGSEVRGGHPEEDEEDEDEDGLDVAKRPPGLRAKRPPRSRRRRRTGLDDVEPIMALDSDAGHLQEGCPGIILFCLWCRDAPGGGRCLFLSVVHCTSLSRGRKKNLSTPSPPKKKKKKSRLSTQPSMNMVHTYMCAEYILLYY